jgi:hypothetical protein
VTIEITSTIKLNPIKYLAFSSPTQKHEAKHRQKYEFAFCFVWAKQMSVRSQKMLDCLHQNAEKKKNKNKKDT